MKNKSIYKKLGKEDDNKQEGFIRGLE